MELPFVSRKKYNELIHKLECLLCHATGNLLSKHTYDLRTMENAVTDHINECYDNGYKQAQKDMTEEIFIEVDALVDGYLAGEMYASEFDEKLAELKRNISKLYGI